MNLQELKEQVLFQIGTDLEEMDEALPFLLRFLNDGYDRLAMACFGQHVSMDHPSLLPLAHDRAVPAIPVWAHGAIADWASWMLYRSGGASRQSRGYVFKSAFEETEKKLRLEKTAQRFTNIPG